MRSWDSAHSLTETARSFEKCARERLNAALVESNNELWPLSDPLNLNRGEHRWMSSDREESYSDWLAWILQLISDAAVILPLFALRGEGTAAALGKAEKVCREVPGEHGRTDVEVWFGERGLLLVEVKVQVPDADHLRSQLQR